MLGGQIQVAFDSGTGLSQAKAGKVRLLAVAALRRHPDFPNAPTFDEAGYKRVDGGPHFSFYAPLRTPRASKSRRR